jgi:serine protease AprX
LAAAAAAVPIFIKMYRAKSVVHAKKVYQEGYTGEGITIALLDSGVMAEHPDLRNRVVCFRDFEEGRIACYDNNGHGTHVAGILCGSGRLSRGKYAGMAPGAKLVVLKVLDDKGNGSTEQVIKALEWVKANYRRYHISLLNFSIGYLPNAKLDEQRRLLNAIEEIWDIGIMVVAAAGNKGPGAHSVTVPGISRKVLTVGASDDQRELPGYLKKGYSGKGPTGCCIVKPEVLAPGTQIISTGVESGTNAFGYVEKSGTSMATPIVCGAMALAFEKNPELTPAALKLLVYQSCEKAASSLHRKSWGILHTDNLLSLI